MIKYCRSSWHTKNRIDEALKPYWEARGELTLHNNLLLYNNRVVVSASLQQEMLEKIHQGHQGIQRCRLCAQISVWWPGLSSQIDKLVQKCPYCVKYSSSRKEPLMPPILPTYPWQKIGTDLFALDGTMYLLAVDYTVLFPLP